MNSGQHFLVKDNDFLIKNTTSRHHHRHSRPTYTRNRDDSLQSSNGPDQGWALLCILPPVITVDLAIIIIALGGLVGKVESRLCALADAPVLVVGVGGGLGQADDQATKIK